MFADISITTALPLACGLASLTLALVVWGCIALHRKP